MSYKPVQAQNTHVKVEPVGSLEGLKIQSLMGVLRLNGQYHSVYHNPVVKSGGSIEQQPKQALPSNVEIVK